MTQSSTFTNNSINNNTNKIKIFSQNQLLENISQKNTKKQQKKLICVQYVKRKNLSKKKKNKSQLNFQNLTTHLNNQKRYIDFVSEQLSHDGLFVRDCITTLMTKHIHNKTDISFWTDCGAHFQSKEMAKFFLIDVPTKFHVNVEWNLFAPQHGKNP